MKKSIVVLIVALFVAIGPMSLSGIQKATAAEYKTLSFDPSVLGVKNREEFTMLLGLGASSATNAYVQIVKFSLQEQLRHLLKKKVSLVVKFKPGGGGVTLIKSFSRIVTEKKRLSGRTIILPTPGSGKLALNDPRLGGITHKSFRVIGTRLMSAMFIARDEFGDLVGLQKQVLASIGSARGNIMRLAMEGMFEAAGINARFVPGYRGMGRQWGAVLSKEVGAMMAMYDFGISKKSIPNMVKVTHLCQTSSIVQPRSGIPICREFVKQLANERAKRFGFTPNIESGLRKLELAALANQATFMYFADAGVDSKMVEVWSKALFNAHNDPGYLKHFKKSSGLKKDFFIPASGAQKILDEIVKKSQLPKYRQIIADMMKSKKR